MPNNYIKATRMALVSKAASEDVILGDCIYVANMGFEGYIYIAGIGLIADGYMQKIGVSTNAMADGPGVGDSNVNGTRVDKVTTDKDPVRDIWDFLQKLELYNCLI